MEPESEPQPDEVASNPGPLGANESPGELVREVTRYSTRDGRVIAVEGYRWESDKSGGNLAAHGKHTGEAFWHVSRMLSDYLCWDCPALQPGAAIGGHRRVIDLGCGLGLAGLVAATLLDETGRVDLTDGDAGVVERAKQSAAANSSVTQPATVAASVLWWGDDIAIGNLNNSASTTPKVVQSTAGDSVADLDTNHQSSVGAYDLVLAADCIYENGSDPSIAVGMAKALAKTVAALLKPEPPKHALLPLRGATPPEEWHAWVDMTENIGSDESDEYVWPPRPSKLLVPGEGVAPTGNDSTCCKASDVRPMCVVGFGRRNVSLSVILDAFEAEGFEHHIPYAGHQDDPAVPGGGCVRSLDP